MQKKRLVVKDKKLQDVVRTAEKKVIKRNFLELLKRAARTISD
jgi:hypothetical protein